MPGMTGPPGKEAISVSRRDEAGNTAQAATNRNKGSWEGCGMRMPRLRGRGKKKANLKQASSEKLKNTGKKARDGLRRWT